MNYNIRYENRRKSTTGVTKGIENMMGIRSDCAPLVVVSGVVPFASEYEGQVSSGLPWNKGQNTSFQELGT